MKLPTLLVNFQKLTLLLLRQNTSYTCAELKMKFITNDRFKNKCTNILLLDND